ncbi:MAG: polysaccharide pyruvyl transferase CsaB [Cyanobacteria bacterium Co-bin13]|nr:polysaccharide pyruvyl transferase CsaB [Cyanobacteria bacterium Co-bin13]
MRAVLCGYYGMGNGGDEALLAALLQMLPAGVTPVVLSGNPGETAQRYGVEAVPRKAPVAVLRALRSADAFIWGGGSLMQDATSLQNPIYYGGLMALAQVMGLKTIAWAQGVGPLTRPLSQRLARYVLRRCAGVSVRDGASAQLVGGWNVPVWQGPDPVWALDSRPVEGLWDLPAPRVAVALRSHPWLTSERLDQFTEALVGFQKATKTCVLLVPFQPAKDLAIAEQIQAHLPGPNHLFCLNDPRQLKGLFRGVEMTIGMRLHALIMAAAEGCRCFALSYDPKVSQVMADLDLPGWDLNPAAATGANDWPTEVNQMTQQWLEHYANGEPLSPDQIQSRTDRAFMHQELLQERLFSARIYP